MKIRLAFVAICLVWSGTVLAQFKSQIEQEHPSVTQSIMRNDYGDMGLFGWFNPENFSMHHTFTSSFMSGGGRTLGINMYTNSMAYKFSDKLNIAADVNLMMSPYGTMPQGVKNQFSGLSLSHAELDYKPWDNFHINLQYNQYPYGGFYNGYSHYSRFYNPYFGYGY